MELASAWYSVTMSSIKQWLKCAVARVALLDRLCALDSTPNC